MPVINKYPGFAEVPIGGFISRPALCLVIAENTAKTGKPFVKITLRDGVNEITAMMFDKTASALNEQGVVNDSVVDVKLSVGEYQGAKNYKVTDIRPCSDTGLSVSDFVKLPPVDLGLMYNEICDMVSGCMPQQGVHTSVSGITLKILSDKKEAYMTSSAAIGMHHNLRGGLLYHSYRMVKAAAALCEVYTILDRELMICGAALHDIGKLWEYSTTVSGEASFTRDGVLYGHLYMGAEYIRSVARDKNCDPERIRLLVHMILSHHGTQEWGAVSCPATPEAFALHYIDNLDAKLYVCEEAYSTLPDGGLTEKKPFGLDNRIYKPVYAEEE